MSSRTPRRRGAAAPLVLADWRDGPAYAAIAARCGASALAWAWEFLRRNSDYRAAWRAWADALQSAAGTDRTLRLYAAWLSDGTSQAWKKLPQRARGPKSQVQLYSKLSTPDLIARQSGEAWGVRSLANPQLDYSINGPRFLEDPLAVWRVSLDFRHLLRDDDTRNTAELHRSVLESLSRRYPDDGSLRVVSIDLTKPIKPQLDSLSPSLTREAEERGYRPTTRRLSAKSFPDYLQLLDADEAGAFRAAQKRTPNRFNVAQTIRPDVYATDERDAAEEWLDEALKSARFLRDGGYRALIRGRKVGAGILGRVAI